MSSSVTRTPFVLGQSRLAVPDQEGKLPALSQGHDVGRSPARGGVRLNESCEVPTFRLPSLFGNGVKGSSGIRFTPQLSFVKGAKPVPSRYSEACGPYAIGVMPSDKIILQYTNGPCGLLAQLHALQFEAMKHGQVIAMPYLQALFTKLEEQISANRPHGRDPSKASGKEEVTRALAQVFHQLGFDDITTDSLSCVDINVFPDRLEMYDDGSYDSEICDGLKNGTRLVIMQKPANNVIPGTLNFTEKLGGSHFFGVYSLDMKDQTVVMVDQSSLIGGDGAPVVALKFEELKHCADLRRGRRPMQLSVIGFSSKDGEPLNLMGILNGIDWARLIPGGSREAAMRPLHSFNIRQGVEPRETFQTTVATRARQVDDAILGFFGKISRWFKGIFT